MSDSMPKPGPHLSALQTLLTPAPDAAVRPSFRELAKIHARAAAELAADADEAYARTSRPDDALVDLAQAHALASLACAAVAPVARQRLTPCASKPGAK